MNEKAEIGSPWQGPLFSLKYFVVISPPMTHDSWFFKIIFIHKIAFRSNPIFFETEIKNLSQKPLTASLPKKFPFVRH